MKNPFGVLFILFGIAMILGGAGLIVDINSTDNSIEGRIGNIFSENYRSEKELKQMASFGLIVVGAVFFILGIVKLASKSNEQKRNEAELVSMKRMQSANSSMSNTANNASQPRSEMSQINNSNSQTIEQLERLSKLLEDGKINQDEFLQMKKKIIGS